MGGCISGRAGEEVAEVGPGGELVGYQHGPVLAKENDVVVLGLPRPRTLSSSRDAFDVSSTEEASEGEEEEDRLFKAKSVRRSKRIEELEEKAVKVSQEVRRDDPSQARHHASLQGVVRQRPNQYAKVVGYQ
eukprot:CAMPEP_0184537956 /NCGR_PEP_ID=MMETSP0198_2-20121128/17341_1 /TAXON_ID=1112570 /ORGANISM="Thraustochytrium sp., Strain LLF1b" /LENGTH=131 /DNA_ID=CAMNT_0026931383 /DNA_START=291 /DNA_END=687 /DNA_ORIENTATION=-